VKLRAGIIKNGEEEGDGYGSAIHGIADGNWSHHMAQGFRLVGGESHELLLA